MRRSRAIAIIALCITLTGCYGTNKELSRYPKIAIPGYTVNDYYKFLFDTNPELIYNAVCNMFDDAGSMASTLSDKKADKKTPKYVLTSLTYKRIVELLQSRDENVVSASLRFLQIFGPKFANKEELIAPVLKLKNKGMNVRYEQMATLGAVAVKSSPVSEAFLVKAVSDPSWLVSREAYNLVDSLQNDKVRMMLVARYRSTTNESEKLIILASLRKALSSGVVQFLSKEALEAKSKRTRDKALRLLRNAVNHEEVLQWVEKNSGKLSIKDIESISNGEDLDADFTGALYGVYIRKGWLPVADFFEKLYGKSEFAAYGSEEEEPSADDIKRKENVKNLVKELMANKEAANRWEVHKRGKELFAKSIYSDVKTAYAAEKEQFTAKVSAILEKHGVDADKRKEFTDFMMPTYMSDDAFDKAAVLFNTLPQEKK